MDSLFTNERCAKCQTWCAPEQEEISIDRGPKPVGDGRKLLTFIEWRFVCEHCGWTWTNEHHRLANRKQFHMAIQRVGW